MFMIDVGCKVLTKSLHKQVNYSKRYKVSVAESAAEYHRAESIIITD